MEALNGALEKSHVLKRRGLIDLAGAVACGTGRSALAYVHYGCHCGIGGSGRPRDDADWCCHEHDCCYEQAEIFGCHPKTDSYRWACEDKVVKCDILNNWCKKELCQCDKEAAKCLGKSPYNARYILFPSFLCWGTQPSCRMYKK
ncbi:phospholipase A2-like isoform X2 [Ascaphus truei]|uniref:phospholipase A2-like isoform X2 n=1 Tax=Ascaphus truei TaxID=8439 RepID=UPI003F5A0E9B